MPELQLVRPDHASALLAFELENRAYFAASVPDRGDDYFATFAERHRELLAWQAEGTNLFHVLVEASGAIVGRINLFDVADAGCGLSELRAAARVENVASRTVLNRTGFVRTGEVVLSGLPGITYRLDLRM